MGINTSLLNTLYTDLNQQIGDFQKEGISEDKALTKVLLRFTKEGTIVVEKKSFLTTLKILFIPGRKAQYNFDENIKQILNVFPQEVKDSSECQKLSKLATELNTIIKHVRESGHKTLDVQFTMPKITYSPPPTSSDKPAISNVIPPTTVIPLSDENSGSNPEVAKSSQAQPVSVETARQRPAPGGKSTDGKLTQVRKTALENQLFGMQKKETQPQNSAPVDTTSAEEVKNEPKPLQFAKRPKAPKTQKITREQAQKLIAQNAEIPNEEHPFNFGTLLNTNDKVFTKFLGFSPLENCSHDSTAHDIAKDFEGRKIEGNFANALTPLEYDPNPNNAWFFGTWKGTSDYAKPGTLAHTLVADMKIELADALQEMSKGDQRVEGALNKLALLCQKANWLVETHAKSSDEIAYVKATLFAESLYKAVAKEYMNNNGKFKNDIFLSGEIKELMGNKKTVVEYFSMNPENLEGIVSDKNAPLPIALKEIKVCASAASHISRPEALLKEFGSLHLPKEPEKE